MEKLAYQAYQQLNSPQKIYEHHESRAHWWEPEIQDSTKMALNFKTK
jgi:hypothetical protein